MNKDVADPIGQPLEVYRRTRDQIKRALPSIIAFIKQTAAGNGGAPAAFRSIRRIAIAADHGGVEMKAALKDWLAQHDYEFTDFGTNTTAAVDYPDYAFVVAREVAAGNFDRGVLICKSGIGMSIAANRVVGARAAAVGNVAWAKLSREHNDANILVLSAMEIDNDKAKQILDVWLKTEFEGGRHERRVNKMDHPPVNSPIRSALAQADREFERERSLESQGVSTTDALRAADDRRRQARAAAEEAEAMLAYTRVTAPFAGVVTGEFVKPGDLATPGRALFSLEGADHLRAEVAVPESLAPLAIGAPVAIELDDAVVTGTLAELSPAADSATRTRLAEVDLPNQAPARSGQFVRVRWPAADDTTLTVPAAALSQLGQMERVFVVAGGHAQLRLVKTGARVADRIQVVSGLDAGEPVILAPPATLRDGQAVESAP